MKGTEPVKMSSELNALLASQHDIHGRLSRAVDNLKKLGAANITLSVVETKIKLIDQLWARFEVQHEAIIAGYQEGYQKSEYATADTYDSVELTYLQQRGVLAMYVEQLTTVAPSGGPAQGNRTESTPNARLPQIKLPQFSGAYEQWPTFRDLFLSVVGSSASISNVEKLHYLRSCVLGPAEKLIKTLSVTEDNHARAWDLLQRHFENKRELIRSNFATFTAVAKMKADTAAELSRVYHAVSAAVNAQTSIGRPIESHGMDLFHHLVVDLFDARTRLEWESSLAGSTEPPKHETLINFMSNRILTLNAVKATNSARTSSEASKSVKNHTGSGAESSRCILCTERHPINRCAAFKGKTVSERKAVVIANRLCFNCLGNHAVAKCQSNKNCFTCNARHHTLLHDVSVNASEPLALSATQRTHDRKAILLATARVLVANQAGENISVRCLIDQGSEVSIVSEALVQKLRLRRVHADIAIIGIGGVSTGASRGRVSLELTSRISGQRVSVIAHILPRLSLYETPRGQWRHITGLPLADPQFFERDSIELLLGAEVYSMILEDGVRRGKAREPIAQKTAFGWILSGGSATASMHQQSLHCFLDDELSSLVKKFWEQEQNPGTPPRFNPDEQKCEDCFAQTHSRTDGGRYVVRLPFASRPSSLSSTRRPAEKLLTAMERRCQRDEKFRQRYREFMREYESLGHMELATLSTGAITCFLPHHGVLKESSLSTKLRVVFNGFERPASGGSLNSHL
jgi:hypothetical protein